MHISKATIRKSEKYTHVDAVVDGTLQESFVIYSGTTFEHENAAWDYLIQCGVSVCDITDEGDEVLENWITNNRYDESQDRVEPHITF